MNSVSFHPGGARSPEAPTPVQGGAPRLASPRGGGGGECPQAGRKLLRGSRRVRERLLKTDAEGGLGVRGVSQGRAWSL